MLLPLAFLVRIADTAEHREWLKRIAGDLLLQMQPCGAIREQMGPRETGRYPSPTSNEAYGTREASVVQENGDPVCDPGAVQGAPVSPRRLDAQLRLRTLGVLGLLGRSGLGCVVCRIRLDKHLDRHGSGLAEPGGKPYST